LERPLLGLNVGSLFSGIGGLDLGLARAGFRHAFLCESDPWRRSVLAHHFPGVPIYEDVRAIDSAAWSSWDRVRRRAMGGTRGSAATDAALVYGESLDLLCGGFPCQDVSVAGRRAGLAGSRSGLFYEFARIAESLRPRWLLVENVPGLLSSNGGRDFGAVLGTLADIGYGVAWRILDSRYFGVPQRRRRVFILGALADGDPRGAAERAGEVLAVGTRCERHPAAGTEARKDVAVASLSSLGSGGPDDNDGQQGRLVAGTLGTRTRHGDGDGDGDGETMIAAPLSHGSNPNSNMAGRRREDDENLVLAETVRSHPRPGSNSNGNLVSFDAEQSYNDPDELAYLTRKLRRAVSSESTGVRRLTPTECERLQALPDGWTAFGPDSRRYAALGDAVTASVAEWIGRRIAR
jgi:DNA (cytosine-5)-methyltransferase 1